MKNILLLIVALFFFYIVSIFMFPDLAAKIASIAGLEEFNQTVIDKKEAIEEFINVDILENVDDVKNNALEIKQNIETQVETFSSGVQDVSNKLDEVRNSINETSDSINNTLNSLNELKDSVSNIVPTSSTGSIETSSGLTANQLKILQLKQQLEEESSTGLTSN